jgi:hypothetical protein
MMRPRGVTHTREMSIQFVVQNDPAYMVGSLFFIITWIVLYWGAKKSRKAILWASITFLPIGPFLESLYLIDYWHPSNWWYVQIGYIRISLEDLIFTFTCSGMCAGFFDMVHRGQKHKEISHITLASYGRLIGAGGFCLVMIWGIWCFGRAAGIVWLHSVNAHVLGCLMVLPFVLVRKTWTISTLSAALGGAVFMLIFYVLYYTRIYPDIFERWWDLSHLTGIRLFGVPIEEVYWMFVTVLFLGPVVRFCMDVTPEKRWVAGEQFRAWRRRRNLPSP